jgi:hypothetical protein
MEGWEHGQGQVDQSWSLDRPRLDELQRRAMQLNHIELRGVAVRGAAQPCLLVNGATHCFTWSSVDHRVCDFVNALHHVAGLDAWAAADPAMAFCEASEVLRRRPLPDGPF